MEAKTKEDRLKWANNAIWEAQWAHRENRAEQWRDSEIYDGGDAIFTQSDWDDMVKAGVKPIPINRAFPTCNLMLGSQIVNRFDIIAK